MMRIFFLLSILSIIISCNNEPDSANKNKLTADTNGNVNNLSKTDSSQSILNHTDTTDIYKFIANFCETDFRESRKQLIAEGKEHDYEISEIRKLGNILKYDVVIPGIEGKMEYSCNPEQGDLLIIMAGDKDVAQMYYEQNKVGLKWDNCNKTEAGEQCETYQDMKSYPLKTRFTASIVNHSSEAMYTFRRVIMPK
jgi:hypothetical protein